MGWDGVTWLYSRRLRGGGAMKELEAPWYAIRLISRCLCSCCRRIFTRRCRYAQQQLSMIMRVQTSQNPANTQPSSSSSSSSLQCSGWWDLYCRCEALTRASDFSDSTPSHLSNAVHQLLQCFQKLSNMSFSWSCVNWETFKSTNIPWNHLSQGTAI